MKNWERIALPLGSALLAACSLGTDPAPQPTAEATQALHGAGPITIHGSGTLTRWLTIGGGITDGAPPALEAAFPIGAPFAVTASYDPAKFATSVNPFPGGVVYQSPPGFTTVWFAMPGHTITGDPDPNLFVDVANELLVDNQTEGLDRLVIQSLGMVDGNATFLGYRMGFAAIELRGADASVLTSNDIPHDLCWAEWKSIRLNIHFIPGPSANPYYALEGYGTLDRTIDSDGDGVSDGAELAHACIDGCAGDTDADGDSLLDRIEIAAGSDPCSTDTDGDGLDDSVDSNPLVALTPEELSQQIDDLATDVGSMPSSAFEGPNANAQAGRQGALANRLEAAAKKIDDGDLQGALDILNDALKWLDGDPSPPDIMPDGPAKTALRAEIEAQIALLEAMLAS